MRSYTDDTPLEEIFDELETETRAIAEDYKIDEERGNNLFDIFDALKYRLGILDPTRKPTTRHKE